MPKLLQLTEADFAHGRQLLKLAFEGDERHRETFYRWLDDNIHGLTVDRVRETYDKIFSTGATARGYKLYDAMLKDYDPVGDASRKLGVLIVMIIVLGGALGGFVYLLRLIFNG